MRPLIGIPCHQDFRDGSRRPIYCNNRAYIHAIENAGGVPVLIPMLNDLSMLDSLLSRLDGLLLSGGIDIQPGLYGEEAHPLVDEPNKLLDDFEFRLTLWALQEDVPTLGVCRGMQVLNVVLGGSLYQDLNTFYANCLPHSNREKPRDYIAHQIKVDAGSLLEKVFGTREAWVNSMHHQAVQAPGKGVYVSGRAEDGVAELLEIPGHRFAVGAQYHPEEIYTKEPTSARLFAAFVGACSDAAREKSNGAYFIMPDLEERDLAPQAAR